MSKIKTETAREYRTTHGMEMPTLKLARIMFNENKLIWKNVEDARASLRYIEGKQGAEKKGQVADKSFVLDEPRPKNPYSLPPSDEESFIPYKIKGHKKGLIINDIHLPYHSQEALTAMLDYAVTYQPDFIFINGDLLDFHSLSFFQKDPRKKHFAEELEMLKEFISILDRTFKCKIYFKFGNHEERYESFLFQKAKELVGVEEFELKTIIQNRCPNIEIITNKRIVDINGLPFIHGHEFGRGVFSPVNAARGLFLQAKHSAVKGDCHTTSEHTEPNIYGKIMTTYSVGALCGLTPQWLPLNKWNHGFATIDLEGTNKYKFRNFRIYKGEIL